VLPYPADVADVPADEAPAVPSGPDDSYTEPRWPAAVALLVALGLYVGLPEAFVVGPKWILPALEAVLVVPLLVADPDRTGRETRLLRLVSILLIALVSLALLTSLLLLVHDLLRGHVVPGKSLVYTAIAFWGTNVIIYALWYWELDSGGPNSRHDRVLAERDFLFPQQASPDVFTEPWHPQFFDYLYTSFTNSTAFSPTDTMPLSTWAKGLMMSQSASAFVTVALVAARAVNILT
jgi:uncharacterized membrane protein